MEEGKKEREKRKIPQNCKHSTELQEPNVDPEVYNNIKMCDWIYTYTYIFIYTHTHKQYQNNSTKIKYNRLTQWTKET